MKKFFEKIYNNKKLMLFIIICAIVLLCFLPRQVVKCQINKEFSVLMDAELARYMNQKNTIQSTKDSNVYAKMLDLESVDYKIRRVGKEDGIYVLYVDIYAECKTTENIESRYTLLAHELAGKFKYLEDDLYFEVGKYKCTYQYKERLNYMFVDLITVYVNGEKLLYPVKRNSDDNNDTILDYKDSDWTCRVSGCEKKAISSEWEKRYCNKHAQGTKTCRYPGCRKELSIVGFEEYCVEHR